MMSQEIMSLIAAFPLGFAATVSEDGKPAVSPKGTFVVVNEAILGFADIRSPGTMRNLASKPWCEVNFIDVLKRKGARIAGTTRLVPRGSGEFDELMPHWRAIWPDLTHRMRTFALIDVDACSTFKTPPYDDGATEEDMVAMYKAKLAALYN